MRKAMLYVVLVAVIPALLGCANILKQQALERRREYCFLDSSLDETTRKCIMAGEIRLGMTANQVWASWGPPTDINKTVGPWGVHEQWVYGDYVSARYLYFENGRFTSWQD